LIETEAHGIVPCGSSDFAPRHAAKRARGRFSIESCEKRKVAPAARFRFTPAIEAGAYLPPSKGGIS
jgi:hypothetical protein